MRQRIIHYLRAGYAGLYLVSPEEQRVEAELKSIAEELGRNLHDWSATNGLVDLSNKSVRQLHDPLECLLAVRELPNETLVLLRDLHLWLGPDVNPVLLRQFRDILREGKTKNKTLVISGCRLCLPPELEREVTVLDFALPGKAELGLVLDHIIESARFKPLANEARESALAAASGLTTIGAENAFALSVVETRAITPAIIAREKAQAVKQSGLLEIIDTTESLDHIGGLDVLKSWLLRRRDAFGQRARAYGLPIPKGLLILGIPGTGKSLTAKATASVFGVPLLRLDAGRLFAGLVGQSEGNLRAVLQTAEAIAPCCLWIDEIEKGFGGTKSSGASDGGTSARVFGTFLNWMQEKQAPVFVVATANDVSQLPSEFLRRGRFDELFFVDLPDRQEREAIWRLQIERHGRAAREFDTVQLAKATEGFTGAEIETAFIEAMYGAFELATEPTELDIAKVLTELVPLSRLMAEQIAGLRTWAKGRARLATAPPAEAKHRKVAVE